MYYKSVNRGLSFTKAGTYSILFILGTGMVAVNTGTNGMFLFLSLGLALLVVSGLLSEQAIKNYHVTHFTSQPVDAGVPFTLDLYAANSSRSLALYGMENILLGSRPKFGVFKAKLDSLGTGIVLRIAPASGRSVSCTCTGVPRGVYEEFLVLQRTNFPFGLLDKFKLTLVKGELMALPAASPEMTLALRHEYRKRLAQAEDEKEFYSHRPYMAGESLRNIDWRKSAGKTPKHWVTREFRAVVAEFGVLIQTDWVALLQTDSKVTYEKHLSALRSACDVVAESSRRCVLVIGPRALCVGSRDILMHLAAVPSFEKRREVLPAPPESAPVDVAGSFISLNVSHDGFSWDDRLISLRVG